MEPFVEASLGSNGPHCGTRSVPGTNVLNLRLCFLTLYRNDIPSGQRPRTLVLRDSKGFRRGEGSFLPPSSDVVDGSEVSVGDGKGLAWLFLRPDFTKGRDFESISQSKIHFSV